MRKQIVKSVVLGASLTLLFFIASGCTRNQTNKSETNIIASTDFYAEMAKAVTKSDANVDSIIKSTNVDPHDFEPTSSIAKKYAKADIIISNGAGYDTWSTDFAKQNQTAKSISVAKLVNYRDGQNEHFWYKTETPKKLVTAVKNQMIQKNPNRKSFYEDNAKEYLQSFDELKKLQNKAQKLLNNKSYLATEPVYDNLMGDLGANNKLIQFSEAVEQGNDPSAKTVRNWQNLINKGEISLVINNLQTKGKVVNNALKYAKKNKIPVINVTETKPKGQSYVQWQTKQLKQVIAALETN